MEYKIIADSSCDLTPEMKKEMNVEIVPLTMRLEDREYVDDAHLNVNDYVKDMADTRTPPQTSCPSPADFINKFTGDESIFIVTLSSKLSGTYQSAVSARDMYLEEHGKKFIHVFDSLSASAGESLICMKISELAKKGSGESEIVEKVTNFINDMKTFFLLESLEHLAKAGRLNHIVAKLASVLDIKPIMGSNGQGSIRLVEKVRGYRKAFHKLIEVIGREGTNMKDKILAIAHCNCIDRAMELKNEVLKLYDFKDIVVVEMAGLSSTYADNKGLVIAF